MATITHGVETSKLKTSLQTPVTVASGVHFVVGTAPIQMADESNVNKVVMLNSYEEAVAAFGYSDDWEKYSLCEEIYTAFVLYGIAPIFLVNVLNPAKDTHTEAVESATIETVNNQIKLPFETIKSTIKITDKTEGEDYAVTYTDGYCVIEFVETTASAAVAYKKVKPAGVVKSEIIGGVDASTHKVTGLQLIDECFPKYVIAPDIILCPNWSHDSNVAAAMTAKAEGINGVFDAVAILDVDTTATGATHYTNVPEWKKNHNFMDERQIVCFPKVKLGDTIFNYSTQLACLISSVDQDEDMGDGTPCESASNKRLQADSMVLADDTEVTLDLQKANYLNDNGIVTALNFYNGFVSWGDYTACYPSNTDPADYFYCVARMIQWTQKTVTLTYWSSIDSKLTRLLIDAVLQSVNDWLAGLTSEGKLLGGRIEFREDENTETALLKGIAKFHVFLAPPVPLVKLEFVFEYDVSYLATLVAAA